jgi:hypothetical protein
MHEGKPTIPRQRLVVAVAQERADVSARLSRRPRCWHARITAERAVVVVTLLRPLDAHGDASTTPSSVPTTNANNFHAPPSSTFDSAPVGVDAKASAVVVVVVVIASSRRRPTATSTSSSSYGRQTTTSSRRPGEAEACRPWGGGRRTNQNPPHVTKLPDAIVAMRGGDRRCQAKPGSRPSLSPNQPQGLPWGLSLKKSESPTCSEIKGYGRPRMRPKLIRQCRSFAAPALVKHSFSKESE